MRTVLVLAPYVPHPQRHGGSIRSRVLLDALAKDHQVHLGVPVGNEDERRDAAELGREVHLALHELPRASSDRASPLGKLGFWLRGRSELFARRWHPSARRRVAELVQQHRFDLVVADSSYVLPLLPGAIPRVLFLHNLEAAVFRRRELVGRDLGERITRACEGACMQREERRAIRKAVATVTVSEHDRELALALAPGAHVVSVPNSVDLAALPLQPPAEPGPVRLLFVGKLDYPPNLEAVHELVEQHLPALRAAFPGLTVVIVGSDAAGHGARLRGIPGVEVGGPVDDLLPVYRRCHAAYLPIRSGGGTRIKILEAWALGLPVLSTSVGAEGLLGEDGVHFRRFETVEQGAAALRSVIDGEGRTLVPSARELVEKRYSHGAAIEALRQVIAAALARAPR